MGWTADGKWTPENDSTADKLTGLLADDSKYITQARQSGVAQANKRGLMNSSIAAGTSESAAIAAALPIASQDASQTATKNNSTLEGNINLENQTRLNDQTSAAQLNLQKDQSAAQANLQKDQQAAELIRQKEAAGYALTAQESAQKTELQKNNDQIAQADRQALLGADVSVANAKTAASADLSGQYLSALGQLGTNTKMKAADRNAYIAELQRVTQQSQTYVTASNGVSLSW